MDPALPLGGGFVPGLRPGTWPILGGLAPMKMLVAVTLSSLFLVPCTAMKSPTFNADALDELDIVRKVVEVESMTEWAVLALS